jgi:peptide/nickel transport system substrate-binding protein
MTQISRFLAFIFLMLIIGCKTDSTSSSNELHVRIKKDPERINPLISPNPVSREIYQYLHLPCADYDPKSLQLTPILIKNIPSEVAIDTGKYKGGVAFDLEFRNDAKWDDGSPITAYDYAFTIKAINLPSTNAAKYREFTENIKDVVVDANNPKKCRVIFAKDYLLALESAITVEVYQKSFYDTADATSKYSLSSIIDTLATQKDSAIASFVAAFNGNEYSRTKIQGSGPYKFVSWQPDQTVVLERKANYWGEKIGNTYTQQGPSKIIYHIIPDDVTAFAQVQNGTIDAMTEMDPDKFESMKTDPATKDKFAFYTPSLMKYYMILLNNSDPKLSDVKVRKAINHLVNVDDIVKNLENGNATRLAGPIHPIKSTYNKSLKPISFDIEAAKTLLAEAGWKDSNANGTVDKMISGKLIEMSLDMYISGQELGKRLGLTTKDNAAKAGVAINLVEKEFKQIKTEHIKTRQYHLVPIVISQDLQPWDDLEGRWHSRSNIPGGTNEGAYQNTEVDKLIDQINVSKDNTKRTELYQQIQQKIYDDCPAVFLYAPQERIIVSKKWSSFATVKRPGYLANTFSLVAK